jgi:hypothetical protein
MKVSGTTLYGLFACVCFAACSTEAPGLAPDAGATGNSDSSVPVMPIFDSGTQESGPGPKPMDASALDAAPKDAAPADPCLGRAVCDSFENGVVGGAPGMPWTLAQNNGSVTVDSTRAFRGQKSLKTVIGSMKPNDSGTAFFTVNTAPLFPLKDNTVYGRFMIWTERLPAESASVHWTFASARGPLNGAQTQYQYGSIANYFKNPPWTDCWQYGNDKYEQLALPTNRWVCVGFMFDGKNNEMRYWQDGVENTYLHVVGANKTGMTCTGGAATPDPRWIAPAFDTVSLGWEDYQQDPAGAHTAWFDDVILDSRPIACP